MQGKFPAPAIGFINSSIFTGYYIFEIANLVAKYVGIIATFLLPIALCSLVAYLIMKQLKLSPWLTTSFAALGSIIIVAFFEGAITIT